MLILEIANGYFFYMYGTINTLVWMPETICIWLYIYIYSFLFNIYPMATDSSQGKNYIN